MLGALDERVAAVSVPNVHWTDGAVLDLEAIADRAHDLGCALVVDASQSAGAMPLDVGRLRPAFLVSVGYKWLLGPFGLTFLYVAGDHRDGEPLEENWISRAGSEDFSRLPNTATSTSPAPDASTWASAARFSSCRWRSPRSSRSSPGRFPALPPRTETSAAIAERCAGLGLAVAPANERGPHMLGASLPADTRMSILPALREANCYAAVRGVSLRIAPHLHVTEADVDRLSDALASATA